MTRKETYWMACDAAEELRAEFGPFQTRVDAELAANRLGFAYLLRYEYILNLNQVEEKRCIFLELPAAQTQIGPTKIRTQCVVCGDSSTHDKLWQAEVWADIHEFENCNHRAQLFEETLGSLKKIERI